VNLINTEMEKTRQELDQGNVTVQKLQKKMKSLSVQKQRAEAAAQANIENALFLHPGSLCIVSETIVILICNE